LFNDATNEFYWFTDKLPHRRSLLPMSSVGVTVCYETSTWNAFWGVRRTDSNWVTDIKITFRSDFVIYRVPLLQNDVNRQLQNCAHVN